MSLGSKYDGYRGCCEKWFLETADDDDALDLIELVARFIEGGLGHLDKGDRANYGVGVSAAEALAELNQRLRENGLGFQYENRILIRLDSQYVHS
jgi:AbiJ N-terminal domain 4